MRAVIPEELTTDQQTSILLQEEATALLPGSEHVDKSLVFISHYPALPRRDEQTRLILLCASEQLMANSKKEWQEFSKSGN